MHSVKWSVYETPIQMHGNANRYSSLDIIHIKQSNIERPTVSSLFREIKMHATHTQTEHANRLSDSKYVGRSSQTIRLMFVHIKQVAV